jgi:hypothetical protein
MDIFFSVGRRRNKKYSPLLPCISKRHDCLKNWPERDREIYGEAKIEK